MAGSLPYGLQRRLEIARALATQPKLLLLDEPAAGMNPQETQELTDFIHKIRDEYDLSILMIEHHMDLVMRISDRIYVLDFGKLIAQGTPSEVQNNPRVIEAWTSADKSPRAPRRRYRTILVSSRRIWGWQTMLKIDELKVSYGGIEAVKGISFQVPDGKIVTLIGANGAGKSTTLRTIAGLVKPAHGRIHLQGEDITSLSPDRIVSKGITLVPEGRHVFPDLTVLENLKIGAYLRKDSLEDDLNWVYDLFPRLKERSWQAAGTLSGGEQQMLAVGRALMSRPKIIMMDEPSLGLAPIVVKGIFDIIREINKQGVTVLLIEQNANMALHIADVGYVLETGRITLTGPGRELLANEDVKKKKARDHPARDGPGLFCAALRRLLQLEGGTLGALAAGGGRITAAHIDASQRAAVLGGVIGAVLDGAVNAGITSFLIHCIQTSSQWMEVVWTGFLRFIPPKCWGRRRPPPGRGPWG